MSSDDVPNLLTQIYIDIVKKHWNTNERVILEQKIQKWPALISLLCSLIVIIDILRTKEERSKVASRMIVALSLCDILYSFFAPFLGSWAAPKGIAYGAVGNDQLCTAAGFLSSVGFYTSIYYNAGLAICYLLMVRYAWKEEHLQKLQYWLLLTPLVIMLPWFLISLIWQGGNFNGGTCSVMTVYPPGCDNVNIQCLRGAKIMEVFWENQQTNIPRGWCLMVLPSIVCLPIVVGCMILLYASVLKRESANDRYNLDDVSSRKHSNQVAYQGILYVWACLAVEVPWVVGVVLWSQKKNPPGLIAVTTVLMPLQGFWNALVYLRPRYWPTVCKYLCCHNCCKAKTRERRRRRTMRGSSATTTRGISTDTMESVPSSSSSNDDNSEDTSDDDDIEEGQTSAAVLEVENEIREEILTREPTIEGGNSSLTASENDRMAWDAESMFLGRSNH